MLSKSELIEIDGWERDHYGDYICEWVRELNAIEARENYEAFILVVQEDGDQYNVSITVSFKDNSVGDLLSAEYSEVEDTVQDAMETGQQFVNEIEEEYDLE